MPAFLARRLRARSAPRLEARAWLALLGFLAYRIWPQVGAAFSVSSASSAATDFHVTTLDGASVPRDALRGKSVLVDIWASWRPPCRLEMPGFQRVYGRTR